MVNYPPFLRRSFLIVCLVLTVESLLAQKQKQLWFRPVQENNAHSKEQVIRIYYDKYGNYYPDVKLALDSVKFFNPDHPKQKAEDTTSGNLYYYYQKNAVQMAALKKFYNLNLTGKFDTQYTIVQNTMVKNISNQIHALVKQSGAKTIIYIIHGFNDADATVEYRKFREVVKGNGYDAKAKPIYVEVFWDGLTAHGGNPATAGIWAHAQDNTRWVCLSLRNLMVKVQDRLPIVVVTHSLGASVGTGALFNTISKWGKYSDKRIDDELDHLQKGPTVKDVKIRLAMLAPAIPGVSTFCDFNNRDYMKPAIKPTANNIDKVIIGFNPYDYATTKAFFRTYAFLSRHFGATTLGCDYGYPNNGKDEISNVKKIFVQVGYQNLVDKMVLPIKFTTASSGHGTQEHGMEFYLKDDPSVKKWLSAMFD